MRASKLNPNSLIRQVVQDAEKALARASEGGQLSRQKVAELPAALQGPVGALARGADQIETRAVVDQLRLGLEKSLARSLESGQLLREELTPGLVGLLSLSSLGLQVQKLLSEQQPLSLADAQRTAESALQRATPDVRSQVAVFKSLKAFADVLQKEAPGDQRTAAVQTLVKDRAKLMRDVANQTLSNAAPAQKKAALQTAHDVYSTVTPKSSRLKTLQKEADGLGVRLANDAAQVQPFFARFLENQNRGQAAQAQQQQVDPRVETRKFPSDAEDNGGDPGDVMVTMKAPSDNEDGGVDGPGGGFVTEKYPSDAEDGGVDGPGDGGGVIETRKFPSDAEDGGAGGEDPINVTMKFPSDAEDGGGDAGGDVGAVTEKYPSDAEDGGEGRVEDGGDTGYVTMKFPSDGEDGGVDGGDPGIVTLKYPSDNEDGGVGDGGDVGDVTTAKFPSDNEDDGGFNPDDMVTTMKYPSDNEDGGVGDGGDGGGNVTTAKFPSDNEDSAE